MKILVDENIPLMTVKELRMRAHDVRDIRGSKDEGLYDKQLWEIAQQEDRLFITTDKSFAQYRGFSHSGILIIRLRQPNRYKIHKRVMSAFSQFSATEWKGMIVIMRDKTMSVTVISRS
ncbi:MAG: DUF5615 family PIN-like protein [Bacteroidota bacterium]|nr:DUF5615 family PIN-like protein [Bacteroidota bacterium]